MNPRNESVGLCKKTTVQANELFTKCTHLNFQHPIFRLLQSGWTQILSCGMVHHQFTMFTAAKSTNLTSLRQKGDRHAVKIPHITCNVHFKRFSRAWICTRLCDRITHAGDGRWPRYQAKSLACPICVFINLWKSVYIRIKDMTLSKLISANQWYQIWQSLFGVN